jgi:D-hydroxyproline dehydrogenase subunit alpha
VRAGECGVSVGIVDDNASLGGQIWRGAQPDAHPEQVEWSRRLDAAGVAALCGMRVFHQPQAGVLLAEGAEDIAELRYQKLILATGARERFLPFPGWTLPNVMGAGGLQAMVKSGLPIRGKKVIVAGTGPLLLAVAAYLRKQGAEIALICEQASWTKLAAFGAALVTYPAKIAQALELRKQISGIAFAANSWPTAAHGQQRPESVTISRDGKLETLKCDYLACGFHLVANLELPGLLGCDIHDGQVQVDDYQRTSTPGTFCAGEPTGIGGVELALVEGQIAGLSAAGRIDEARHLFPERSKARRFAWLLDRTFQLRPELKNLPAPETIVCRCEDVVCSRLKRYSSWRAAKLQTRCGMGPCQGRVCGPAAEFLFGWKIDSVRPPIFPVRIGSLAATGCAGEYKEQH